MVDSIFSLLPKLQHFGLWGYWLVLLICFAESLVAIGSIVPGATLVVFLGFLSAHGYFDINDLIWFAGAGALLGDLLSFYLGTEGTRFFRRENRLLKLSHLDKATEFFRKHGNKSILLGRFIGPLRSFVPFVAGLSKMKKRSFLFWSVVSSFLWATAYLFLGYFFGGSFKAIQVWSTRFGIFLLFLALFFMLVWLVLKKSGPFFQFMKSVLSSLKQAVISHALTRRLVGRYPAFFGFLHARLDKNKFSGLPLTLLALAFAYFLSLFLGIIQDIINSEDIIALDNSIASLLYTFRDQELVDFFLGVTALLSWPVLITSAITVCALCWLWRRRIYIFPFLLVLVGTEFFNYFGKLAIHRLRPAVAFYSENSFSFPSSHASLSMALYGFLIYLIFREIKKWRWKIHIVFLGFMLIFFVGLSRLYLGVHFLSDVWGGYLLGMLWLIIGVSITELWIPRYTMRSPIKYVSRIKMSSAVLILAQLAFYLILAVHYHPPLRLVSEASPQVIAGDAFNAFRYKFLPRFTESLFGKKQMPLSFMILAQDDRQLIRAMQKSGWYQADPTDFASLAKLARAAFLYERYPNAPMTPSFWDARVQDLGFEKPVASGQFRIKHRARFWRTPLQAGDRGRLYVGIVNQDRIIKWFFAHKIHPDIDAEREYVFKSLQDSGHVLDYQRTLFVDPTKGVDGSNDRFFTDGKLYHIILK